MIGQGNGGNILGLVIGRVDRSRGPGAVNIIPAAENPVVIAEVELYDVAGIVLQVHVQRLFGVGLEVSQRGAGHMMLTDKDLIGIVLAGNLLLEDIHQHVIVDGKLRVVRFGHDLLIHHHVVVDGELRVVRFGHNLLIHHHIVVIGVAGLRRDVVPAVVVAVVGLAVGLFVVVAVLGAALLLDQNVRGGVVAVGLTLGGEGGGGKHAQGQYAAEHQGKGFLICHHRSFSSKIEV